MLRSFVRAASEVLTRICDLPSLAVHRGLEALERRLPHLDLSRPARTVTASYTLRFALASGGERTMRATVEIAVPRWSHGGARTADTAVRSMLWHIHESHGGRQHWTPALASVAHPQSLRIWQEDKALSRRFLAGESLMFRIPRPLRLRDHSLPLRRDGDKVHVRLVDLDCWPRLDALAAPARNASRLAAPMRRLADLGRR